MWSIEVARSVEPDVFCDGSVALNNRYIILKTGFY